MESACFYCKDSPNKDKPEYTCKYHSPHGSVQIGMGLDTPSFMQTSKDQFNPKWKKIIEDGK